MTYATKVRVHYANVVSVIYAAMVYGSSVPRCNILVRERIRISATAVFIIIEPVGLSGIDRLLAEALRVCSCKLLRIPTCLPLTTGSMFMTLAVGISLEEERKGAAYSPMYRHTWLFG